MLLVSKVRPGGGRYYLEPTGAFGAPAMEAEGYWIGRRRAGFGLSRAVDPLELEAVLDGRHPVGGDDFGADRRRVEVAAFDLTFCAPKSVSLLFALGDGDVAGAVGNGHERAVAAAMSYVEDRALAVRRADPVVGRVPTAVEAVPAAAYLHRTSRALDPHLHTHVVVPNVGRGPDGSWSALDGRGIYAHAGAAGALYHAQLRHELTTSLGVDWGPLVGGRADVAGVSEAARHAFSRRSAEIAAHLDGLGIERPAEASSPRAAMVAALVTRADKDLTACVEELRPSWLERARVAGLGPRRIDAVFGRVPARAISDDAPAVLPGRPDLELTNELAQTRRADADFARRHAVRAWAASRTRGAPAPGVEERVDAFLSSPAVVDAYRSVSYFDGPGVAERSRALSEDVCRPLLERAVHQREHRRLEELLQRRGRSLEPDTVRPKTRDLLIELEISTGFGFGR